MGNKKYELYKTVMKRDQKAIDEIETLEDAKEILKMITNNVHLNGEIYSLQQEYRSFGMIMESLKDCLSCSNSHSDKCDVLHCMERNCEVVEDNEYCDKWNG